MPADFFLPESRVAQLVAHLNPTFLAAWLLYPAHEQRVRLRPILRLRVRPMLRVRVRPILSVTSETETESESETETESEAETDTESETETELECFRIVQ